MARKDESCQEDGCLCASGDLLFLACAGGSNVGQISNKAAVVLAKEGGGRLFCLAGIGAHLDTMIVAAKERRLVAIDGCPVQCAKKILDHAGLEAALSVVITDFGIDKSPRLDVEAADCVEGGGEHQRRSYGLALLLQAKRQRRGVAAAASLRVEGDMIFSIKRGVRSQSDGGRRLHQKHYPPSELVDLLTLAAFGRHKKRSGSVALPPSSSAFYLFFPRGGVYRRAVAQPVERYSFVEFGFYTAC